MLFCSARKPFSANPSRVGSFGAVIIAVIGIDLNIKDNLVIAAQFDNYGSSVTSPDKYDQAMSIFQQVNNACGSCKKFQPLVSRYREYSNLFLQPDTAIPLQRC